MERKLPNVPYDVKGWMPCARQNSLTAPQIADASVLGFAVSTPDLLNVATRSETFGFVTDLLERAVSADASDGVLRTAAARLTDLSRM